MNNKTMEHRTKYCSSVSTNNSNHITTVKQRQNEDNNKLAESHLHERHMARNVPRHPSATVITYWQIKNKWQPVTQNTECSTKDNELTHVGQMTLPYIPSLQHSNLLELVTEFNQHWPHGTFILQAFSSKSEFSQAYVPSFSWNDLYLPRSHNFL